MDMRCWRKWAVVLLLGCLLAQPFQAEASDGEASASEGAETSGQGEGTEAGGGGTAETTVSGDESGGNVNIAAASNDVGAVSDNTEEEEPTFAPKVVVVSAQFSKNPIQNGDEVQADITLKNTSASMGVRNMTITVSADNTYFSLLSATDTIYVDSLPPGETYVASYVYKVNGTTPQGQYTWTLAMDYADSEGAAVSTSGKVQVSVELPVKIEFGALNISGEVQVADVVEAQVQAMNLGRGKVYNVRAVLEADGLNPQGTIFIGDMEGGTTASGSTYVSVTSLSGDALYGNTTGTVTFSYEDESGKEYTETAEFSTTITSPFSENAEETEDKTGQWWILMAVSGVILCGFAVFAGVRRLKRRNAGIEEDEE